MTLPQFLFAGSGLNPAASFLGMSPYKEGVSYTKRVPNCQKCGQHGRKSRLKGHKRVCPFKDCNCPKCQVVSERQKLMADQIKIRRRQRKDTIMNLTREKITATLNAAAAVAAVPVPGFPQLNALYSAAATANNNQSILSNPNLRPSLTTGVPFGQLNMNNLGSLGFHPSLFNQVDTGRTSPMSMNSMTASCSSSQAIMSPSAMSLSTSSHASSPVLSTVSSDLTPPQSAGLAAPIPLSLLQTLPAVSNSGLMDNQQLLQLLLLCQQQQSAFTPTVPTVLNPTTPDMSALDVQEQIQQLLAMAAMNAGKDEQQQPVQQLSPPPEDLKKFVSETSDDIHGKDIKEEDEVDVV